MFSLIITIVILIFSILFLTYTMRQWNQQTMSDLENTVESMVSQIDTIIATMDYAAVDLFSQPDFIPSLSVLTHFDRDDKQYTNMINDAMFFLEKSLYKYSLMRDFHRIAIYTAHEDYFTNHLTYAYNNEGIERWITDNPFFSQAVSLSGGYLITPAHEDIWVRKDPKQVFSLIRAVIGFREGETLGYVEIQQDMGIIQEIVEQPAEDDTQVIITNAAGDVLYEKLHPVRERQRLFTVSHTSEYSGVTAELTYPVLSSLRSLIGLSVVFISLILVVLMAALFSIRYFTNQITKPVQELVEHMNTMDFENLDVVWENGSRQNEIEAMKEAFTHLQDRLQESINKEIVLQTVQLQAKFSSLQSQVNPHFLFNVLNVISSKGLESGNEEICEICENIASLLRYSSSTNAAEAPIPDEIYHVLDYLKLIKKRYEYKIDYRIEIDLQAFSHILIPKIVLQPLVENCIMHNLGKGAPHIEVRLSGHIEEDDSWCITIADDGSGMPEDELESLREELISTRYQLSHESAHLRLDFGGLGVVNTFARLYLFFGESLDFQIASDDGFEILMKVGGSNA